MNERDKELAKQAWTENDWDGHVDIPKLNELVRADERSNIRPQSSMAYQEGMEVANRAATASWTLMCKKMVEFEREACAKVCEEMAYVDPKPHHYANAIRTVRARSQP